MKIRSKLIAVQVCLVGVVIVMGALAYFGVQRADHFVERVTHAHRQLESITTLSVRADRYSEQIAEMLLFGEGGRIEFEEAHRDLERSFGWLEATTEREISFLEGASGSEQELADERNELALIVRMREVAAQMHATALGLLSDRLSGSEDQARLRYYEEIEENLDDELQRLIDLAIADERQEVNRVDGETHALTHELIAVVLSTTAAAIVVSAAAVAVLTRALSQPIAQLVAGVEAIGAGQLDYRIPVKGHDELALLSRHFNRMAAQLEQQRGELLRHQSLLEAKVRERTAQLEEANRRLKDLDRLRVLFLADISHELRTPLTVLRGEAEVTLRNRFSQPEEYRETLQLIVEQAAQMSRLVDDLLFLTRAEADSIRFQIDRLDLRDVVDEAIEEGRILANGQVTLAASYPNEPVWLFGDRQRLKQTLVIALDNAIKYSHAGTTVDVELRLDADEAVTRVCNRGNGIPPEDLPYVFDRFYRGRHSACVGGSGLGLSIAKWIVEKHGGAIGLTSRPDGETELNIRLKCAA